MKVAVIFHCFYFDLLDEFLDYFKKITVPFQLFMTVPKDVYPSEEVENLTRRVLEIYPDAVIISCKNYGADIYPCFCVMDYILLHNMHFDKYVKVHTKKSLWREEGVGEVWRKNLCSAIFDNFSDNLKEEGLVADGRNTKEFLTKGIETKDRNLFEEIFKFYGYSLPAVGTLFSLGTMFMIDGGIWEDFFMRNKENPFNLSMIANGQIPVAFEKMWELLPCFYGKKIVLRNYVKHKDSVDTPTKKSTSIISKPTNPKSTKVIQTTLPKFAPTVNTIKDLSISDILTSFENLEIWKREKPKKFYQKSKKRVHYIHWYFVPRVSYELTNLERFHFSMLYLSDFDNKFDEIFFNVALDSTTSMYKSFITNSIHDLTKNGTAKVHIDFVTNNAKEGEFRTWWKFFQCATNPNENYIVFYSHFKGVRHSENLENIKYWSYLMYQGCLMDGWYKGQDSLKTHASYGAFIYQTKIHNTKCILPRLNELKNLCGFKGNPNPIHYTGTFYFWNGELVKKYYRNNNIHINLNKLLTSKRIGHICENASIYLTGGGASTYFGTCSNQGAYQMLEGSYLNEYIRKFKRLYVDNNKSSEIIVYTVISGNYDILRNPAILSKNCRYICFTDQKLTSNVWEIRSIPEELSTLSQVKRQRMLKILSHKYLPSHQWSVYIDANIQIIVEVDTLISNFCKNAEFSTIKHPVRDCIYEEEKKVISIKKDLACNTNTQIQRYRAEGFPEHFGLNETNLLVRKNCSKVTRLEKVWATEVQNGSHRDQLSFNYCLWKLNYSVNSLDKDLVRHSKHFNYFNHK